jgi:hypothetical protein
LVLIIFISRNKIIKIKTIKMKKQITLKELVDYLDKKSSEVEGESILAQMDRIDTNNATITTTEILNKMYELGYKRGKIIGKRDALVDLATFLNMDSK